MSRIFQKASFASLMRCANRLGDEIANRAFSEWLSTNGNGGGLAADKNARAISDALQPLIETGKLSVPRGGYMVRRGRGRVIIERLE